MCALNALCSGERDGEDMEQVLQQTQVLGHSGHGLKAIVILTRHPCQLPSVCALSYHAQQEWGSLGLG